MAWYDVIKARFYRDFDKFAIDHLGAPVYELPEKSWYGPVDEDPVSMLMHDLTNCGDEAAHGTTLAALWFQQRIKKDIAVLLVNIQPEHAPEICLLGRGTEVHHKAVAVGFYFDLI
ncbi:hypothetical protein AWB68_02803 [Caballeronia choica]|uniref:Uncharacterized protein n=1 Tax=Caballeronia choica TaxID=326476 RepID=A0A158ILY1_9BURK|nr:hypothetical protein AWB68_02803 [Caballeronia choica]